MKAKQRDDRQLLSRVFRILSNFLVDGLKIDLPAPYLTATPGPTTDEFFLLRTRWTQRNKKPKGNPVNEPVREDWALSLETTTGPLF
jgi:hypothetical protein